jgi:hypothetical protein
VDRLYKPSRGPGGEDGLTPVHDGAPVEPRADLRPADGADLQAVEQTATAGGVMTNLPRRRPQRRSARRAGDAGPAAPAIRAVPETQAGEPAAATPRAHLTATDGGRAGMPSRPKRARRNAATARRKAVLRAAPEPPPTMGRLALDGALEAAKLPFKLGTQITMGALDSIAHALRAR